MIPFVQWKKERDGPASDSNVAPRVWVRLGILADWYIGEEVNGASKKIP